MHSSTSLFLQYKRWWSSSPTLTLGDALDAKTSPLCWKQGGSNENGVSYPCDVTDGLQDLSLKISSALARP